MERVDYGSSLRRAHLAQGIGQLVPLGAEGAAVHEEHEGIGLPLLELYGLSLRSRPCVYRHAHIIDGA